MTATTSRSSAFAALLLATLVVAVGCGGTDEGGRPKLVATVGDAVITKQDFDRWRRSASVDRDPTAGLEFMHKGCRKGFRSELNDAPNDPPQALTREVMDFLVQAAWLEQETQARDITVSEKEARTLLRDQRSGCFASRQDFDAYLKETGNTEDQFLFRVRLYLLQQELTEDVKRSAAPASEKDITTQYATKLGYAGRPSAEDRRNIKEALESKAQLKALEKFIAEFRRNKHDTACAPRYFVPSSCGSKSPLSV